MAKLPTVTGGAISRLRADRHWSAVPEELAMQVHQVKDAERLEALFRCAAVVDRVADFTRKLAG